MAAAPQGLSPQRLPGATWDELAAEIVAWATRQALPMRELVVLLPGQVWLAPLRKALLARHGGWQPRVETPDTLAQTLGPSPPVADGAPGMDRGVNRLQVAQLLRGQPFGQAWERRDRREFGLAVAAVVDAAEALMHRAATLAPAQRPGFWRQATQAMQAGSGGLQGSLAALATAWARDAATPATDRLFELDPAGWIIVSIAAEDALPELARVARSPCLWLSLDPEPGREIAALAAAGPGPRVWLCDDREAEARASASVIIQALNDGHAPVALVSLDRGLSRRVHALLQGAGVAVDDETGWSLATARVAATVHAWLQVASPVADADDWLDWFKAWPGAIDAQAVVDRLEIDWRACGRAREPEHDPQAVQLWQRAKGVLAPLREGPRTRTLGQWLNGLREVWLPDGVLQWLARDAAGSELLRVLHLDSQGAPGFDAAAAAARMPLSGFVAWVEEELEGARFVVREPAAEVVLTPLSRAPMRDFAAVVMPGADAFGLGAADPAAGLISEATAASLGLATLAERRRQIRLRWALLLRHPRLTVLRRRQAGDEPVAASPELLALDLALREGGGTGLDERVWQPAAAERTARPSQPPVPVVKATVPEALSASRVEALHDCPYRFYVRAVLGLGQSEEIDREPAKRDYGSLLHEALHRFHAEPHPARDAQALRDAMGLAQEALGLDETAMLPYLASFEAFVPRYLAWQAQRESMGWRWQEGETSLACRPLDLAPTRLHGRLDRADRDNNGKLQLLDYKTGDPAALKRRLRQEAEEVQLPFYALLMAARGERLEDMSGAYLSLDDPTAPALIEVDHLAPRAEALLTRLARTLDRMREGEPLAPLGEGRICDHCEGRGLCRRDDWLDAAVGDHLGDTGTPA